MNYQELELKELQKLMDVKRSGINVSKEYYALCKEFSYKRARFNTLEELNQLFERFLSFCDKEEQLRFDITPYGRGGSQKQKKELQGKIMHCMRTSTMDQMEVLRNSFHSAFLKFDTELLKWKLYLNVNFAEEREGKEHKTFYTNYFHLGFRMLLSEEEVSANVFLSSLNKSLSEAALNFSKEEFFKLQEEIAKRKSFSFDNQIIDNATKVLKDEEEEQITLSEKATEEIKISTEKEPIVEQKTEIASQTTTTAEMNVNVLYYIFKKNFEEYNEDENEKAISFSDFKKTFIKNDSTKDSVKESIAKLFEIELFDLIE